MYKACHYIPASGLRGREWAGDSGGIVGECGGGVFRGVCCVEGRGSAVLGRLGGFCPAGGHVPVPFPRVLACWRDAGWWVGWAAVFPRLFLGRSWSAVATFLGRASRGPLLGILVPVEKEGWVRGFEVGRRERVGVHRLLVDRGTETVGVCACRAFGAGGGGVGSGAAEVGRTPWVSAMVCGYLRWFRPLSGAERWVSVRVREVCEGRGWRVWRSLGRCLVRRDGQRPAQAVLPGLPSPCSRGRGPERHPDGQVPHPGALAGLERSGSGKGGAIMPWPSWSPCQHCWVRPSGTRVRESFSTGA